MELTLESDAEALWQDAMDLLTARNTPAALLAMLQNCTPTALDEGVLRVETPMRMVAKKVSKNADVIEECLEQAAFEPVRLDVQFVPGGGAPAGGQRPQAATPAAAAAAEQDTQAATTAPVPTPEAAEPQQEAPSRRSFMGAAGSTMSREEIERWNAATGNGSTPAAPATSPEDTAEAAQEQARERHKNNPLVERSAAADSKLTFDRFVIGDENELAYNAALQVANGNGGAYNPLFIYGKSGLGKTHLLRAIQNYLAANDPSRTCVYRDASQFTSEYVAAMNEKGGAGAGLRRNYEDIDVLIIDDVQGLAGRAGTLGFFFDIFNVLKDNGKQIVIAADRTPAELGMGEKGFDERMQSRISSGLAVSVQVPSYELKLKLIEVFCGHIREDNLREHVGDPLPEIPERLYAVMADRAGSNIRMIEGFCQRCLIQAGARHRRGGELTEEDVVAIARETWPENRRSITIETVQKYVEKTYDVSHDDLVGSKRNKDLMSARHAAIWLCRELCNVTLEQIGTKFGGRSHATVKHSLLVIEKASKEDKVFYDQLMRVKDGIISES